jgi:hypothetical protein
MLSPGSDDDFLDSLPETTSESNTVPELKTRKPRSDAGKPRGRKPRGSQLEISGEPKDEKLERAKQKFASLGGGTAIKSLFVMMDKPLEPKEEEDVDDYFYLLSKKAQLDPSDSWIIMFFCAFLLVGRLLGTRTAIGGELKKLFSPKKTEEVSEDDANETE